MNERCENCGAELFAGQQFCRRCGAAVRGAADEAPTQLFPAGTPTATAAPTVGTSPLGGGGRTDSVAAQQPTAYTPPLASFQQTSPLAVAPPAPRRRRRGAWLLALLVVFVLGAGIATGAGYVWWRSRQQPVVVRKIVTGGGQMTEAMPVPPIPPDLGERIKDALKGKGVPLPLDEAGATVSGDDTVLTETYALDEDATFAVRAVSGSVTVTGADGDRAVVKITKHGGSPQERSNARVLMSQTDEGLTLLSATPPNGRVSVSYEVQLPRNQHQLEISADKGDVKVEGFDGVVLTDVKAGDVEFRDVSGQVRSRIIKGNVKVFYAKPEREGAQEFSVVKGNIEATVADGANADLKAETLDGDINLDDSFGLTVEKAPAGRHVAGRLGDGGEALLFKVTDGDIKLKK
jgi:hypothetical protein